MRDVDDNEEKTHPSLLEDEEDDVQIMNDQDNDDEYDFIKSHWENGVETGLEISCPHSILSKLSSSPSTSISTSTSPSSLTFTMEKPLFLSTKLSEDAIAPLFDGTQWAGTRVWKAAIVALEYLLRHHVVTKDSDIDVIQQKSKVEEITSSIDIDGGNSSPTSYTNVNNDLLELGCGLGVPGMIWHSLLSSVNENNSSEQTNTSKENDRNTPVITRPRVILTDHGDLIEQLRTNVESNFPPSATNNAIQAKSLDWSDCEKDLSQILNGADENMEGELVSTTTTTTTTTTKNPKRPFGICLNCDCIYEPLYGREAWESLSDVLSTIAKQSPSTILVTSVERRKGDGLEDFLQRLTDTGTVRPIERVLRDDDDKHHIIEIYVTKGIE